MSLFNKQWEGLRELLSSGMFWITIVAAWLIIDSFVRGDERGGEQGIAIYLFILGTSRILKGIGSDDSKNELLFLNESSLRNVIEEKSKCANEGWVAMLIAFIILFSIK